MKTKKVAPRTKKAMTKATPVLAGEESFAGIAGLIAEARERAVKDLVPRVRAAKADSVVNHRC